MDKTSKNKKPQKRSILKIEQNLHQEYSKENITALSEEEIDTLNEKIRENYNRFLGCGG